MLEEKDLQAIASLMDQKLKENNLIIDQKFKESNKILKVELDEIVEVMNESFTHIETRFNEVDKELAKRPTKEEVFGWADERIVTLEIAQEKHDYLHINELDKLPSRQEISKALIEKGLKQKAVV